MGFASCKAFGRSISASLPKPQTPFPGKGAILLGLPPLDQARMLAVSHTKPLHDAVAQMADDLYGASPQSKDALVACQKFCTMQNQQSKQHSTPHFYIIKRFIDSLKRYIFGVPLYFWEGCGFYTGCDLNYLSNIHLLRAAIIF